MSFCFSLVEVELERMRRRVVSWRKEAVRMESMMGDVLGCLTNYRKERQVSVTYCRVRRACSSLSVLLADEWCYQRWHHKRLKRKADIRVTNPKNQL